MKRLIVISFVLLMLLLSACGSSSKGSTSLKAELDDYTFNPGTFTVPAGKEITLELSNKGTVEHEFVIMKADASVPFDENDEGNVYWETEVEAGSSTTATFTAPADAGEYQVVCGLPSHIEHGMTGKLMVVAP